MLKFSEFLLEEYTTAEIDAMASKSKTAPEPSTTPTTSGVTKIKIKTNDDLKNIINKYLGKSTANTTPTSNEVEYNGVYVLANKNFIIEAQDGYGYGLTFYTSEGNVPLYHLNGIGVINKTITDNDIKGQIIVDDKKIRNVKYLFPTLNQWMEQLKNTPTDKSTNTSSVSNPENVNASFIFSFDGFINEEIAPIVSIAPKAPLPLNNFLSLTVSNFYNKYLKSDENTISPFSRFKDYGEVLSTMRYLLGLEKRGSVKLINDNIYMKDFIKMENMFVEKSKVNEHRSLWGIRIKTANTEGEVEFKKVTFNTLIKNGSKIKIIKYKSDPKIKIDVKIKKIEEKTAPDDKDF
jgi:hypothetical protein